LKNGKIEFLTSAIDVVPETGAHPPRRAARVKMLYSTSRGAV
jgi:hypothetical protein